MKVGIIGCGLIGGKRADALASSGDELVATYDLDEALAQNLARKHKTKAATS